MTTNLDPPTAAPAPPFIDVTPATLSPAPPDPGVRQGDPLGRVGRAILAVGAVLVVAAVAFAIGNAATGSEAAPTPKTPAVCLTALDDAERVVSLAHTGMGYEADAMRAAGELDAAGIDEQTANIAALTPQVQAAVDTYNADAAQCRSAGPAS